jgi:hypothetical protein
VETSPASACIPNLNLTCCYDTVVLAIMHLYQVMFNNNIAASSSQLDPQSREKTVQMENLLGKRSVSWMTIYANDKNASMRVANKVVRDYFSFL